MLAPPDPSSTVPESAVPPGFGSPAVQSPAPSLPTRPVRAKRPSPSLPTPSLPTRPLSSRLLPGLETVEGTPTLPASNSVLEDPFAPTLPMTDGATSELTTQPDEVPSLPARNSAAAPGPAVPKFAAFQHAPRLAPRPTASPVAPAPAAGVAATQSDPVPVDPVPIDPVQAGHAHRPLEMVHLDADAAQAGEARDESLPDPPAPLLRTGWLGKFVLLAGFLAVPGLFAGDFIGVGLAGASWVALVVWSAMVTANARRSRPSTVHARAPRPASGALSWFIAPILPVGALYALVLMTGWVDEASYDEQGSRSTALALVVVVIVVAMFAGLYRPYGLLARTARWVNADAGKVRKWFVAPFLAALLAIGIQLLATLLVVADTDVAGTAGATSIGAVVLIVVSFCLPWVAWLFTGSRAIRAIESAVAHTHARAVQASLEPEEIPAHVAAYIRGAAATAE